MTSATIAGDVLAIVLAAGEGTRMKSAQPKVLHEIAGLPMLGHVLATLDEAGIGRIGVVVGPDRSDVESAVGTLAPAAELFVQRERRGTAHAVLQARAAIARGTGVLLVLFGDTPLVRAETVRKLVETAGEGVAVLGFEAADPTGYGRLLVDDGELVAIREHKDASGAERAVTLCNAGLMALAGNAALTILDRIGDDNSQKEFYLPDAVAVARGMGLPARVSVTDEAEVRGVNDRAQLAAAEAIMQRHLRQRAMVAGVTMLDPDSVHLSHDTRLGPDVLIEPHVFMATGVSVAAGATIRAFSHLEGCEIGAGCTVGPFARLRPGARLAEKAKVGNFVEIKNAAVDAGAKISHLSYIGDAHVGAEANIGAGTITCNYDGFRKFHTEIGAHAFIGSNSALVAPVTIGAGAFVGSGSVVTGDVPADALAVARGRQVVKPEWAIGFRARPENLAKANRAKAKRE